MNAIQKSSMSGGCGCGGAGSKSGGCGCGSGGQTALCACGDVGCATCRNQGFVRPRFFAGQLLTEEDLQQLIDYVVAKNRLHNQRLWGDGVVCGLEVSCNPCGGGTVTVNPGYALDCCGNDLLLGCPQPLDINAMVRDLKRNLLGGQDCGDPCPPKKKELKETNGEKVSRYVAAPPTGANSLVNQPPIPTPEEYPKEPVVDTTRHYCLYIRYCENSTDPVTPYATDEGCSYQSCQPTRVSEGVSFELRCDGGCGHQPDISDRICECLGDLDSAFQTTRSANSFHALANLQGRVPNVEFTNAPVASENFVKAVKPLSDIRILKGPVHVNLKEKIEGAPSAVAADTSTESSDAEQPGDISVEEFEGWLSDLQTAGAQLASYHLAEVKSSRPKENSDAKGLGQDEVGAATQEFRHAAFELEKYVEAVPAPQLARGYYKSALTNMLRLTTAEAMNDENLLVKRANGSFLDPRDLQSSAAPMAAMKEELLDRLDRSPRLGDCQLRRDVEAIRIPGPEADLEWEKASKALHEAWVRYLKDCLCAALNPPCVTCEDTAVLLACIEVKDCEVVEICNLKRKFVISSTAARYWLPQLNELGEELEKLCCPEPICIEQEEDTKPGDPATKTPGGPFGGYGFMTKQSGHIDLRIFEELCGKQRRTASRPQDQAWRAGRVQKIAPGPYGRPSLLDLYSRVSDRSSPSMSASELKQEVRVAVADLLKTDEAKAEIRSLVTERQPKKANSAALTKRLEEISNAMSPESLTKSVAEALKADPGLAGEAMAGMADERVAAAVGKMKTTAAKDLKDVKRIKTENAELTKRVQELGDQAKELMARIQNLEGGTPQ